jgi:LPPG:FO 2-phospho-L-lactate transferase
VIVGLGGGIGAARLWRALLGRVDPGELTLITNNGDDLWWYGLRVCPDLDTVLYTLTGRQDPDRGWGLRGETWHTRDALRALGEDPWFNVGDLDLATHLYRTGALRDGRRLSEITAELAAAAGLGARLLPMTDDEVETHVRLACGNTVHYQEFYVRRRAEDRVLDVEYRGAADAKPAPGVLDALAGADRIILGPSNPLASIGPILAVPGIRDAIAAAAAPVIAVTPIVTGVQITDPGEQRRADSRATLLAAVGLQNNARAAAELLRGLLNCFVFDRADGNDFDGNGLGSDVMAAPTLVDEHGQFPHDPRFGGDLVDLLLTHQPGRFGPMEEQR